LVWPENDCFGKPDMPVEEEFLALREIFFADLGVVFIKIVWLESLTTQKELKQSNQCATSRAKPHVDVIDQCGYSIKTDDGRQFQTLLM
ncbi:hypothetical protein PV327_007885, partial [Microctonus hyperodae]